MLYLRRRDTVVTATEVAFIVHNVWSAAETMLLHALSSALEFAQVYEALSYSCMRPSATSVCRLQLLVYEALSC